MLSHTKRPRVFDEELIEMMNTKFVSMSDALDLNLHSRDAEHQQLTRAVIKLTRHLDVETRRVARLRRDITGLKSRNRKLQLCVRKHADLLSSLSDEAIHTLSYRLDIEESGTSSSDAYPDKPDNSDNPGNPDHPGNPDP